MSEDKWVAGVFEGERYLYTFIWVFSAFVFYFFGSEDIAFFVLGSLFFWIFFLKNFINKMAGA